MSLVSADQSEQFKILPPGLRLSLLLLGLMVTLPFLQPIHHAPIPSFYEEWWAMLLGVLAVVAALSTKLPRISLPSVALIPCVIFLAVIEQFMARQVTVPVFGLFYCGYLAWAVVMACLGATLAEYMGRARLFRFLAIALLAGTLISAMLAFAQRLEIHLPYQLAFPAINGRIYANIGQPNLLVTYLWIGIASLIYLRERSAISSAWTVVGIILLGGAAGLTGARIAYLHGCGLILVDLLFRRQSTDQALVIPPVKRPGWPYLLVGLVSVFVAGEISRIVPWTYSTEATALSRMHANLISGDARLVIWRDALSLISDHPWAGNGVGNFPWRMVEAAAAAPNGAMTFPGAENAHNMLLQIGADFGLPLLSLVIFLGVRWVIQLLSRKAESPDKWVIGILALLAIHSQLEYPLWNAYYLGPCALLAGSIDPRPHLISALRHRVLQLAFVIAAVALLPLRLDYGTLDAVVDNAPIEDSVREDWQRRMSTLAGLAKNSVLSAYAFTALGNVLEPDHKIAVIQSNVCERTMVMWPDAGIITNCAVLRQLTGRDAEARALLSLTQRAYRDPQHQSAIRATLEQAEKNNPGMINLGMSKKSRVQGTVRESGKTRSMQKSYPEK